MKKRILSFLMACMMVASTIIISKPLVHVHAAESDETTKWTMDPGAFYDTGTDGPFQIGDFSGSKFRNISSWPLGWNVTEWDTRNDAPAASADKWSRQAAWAMYECFSYDKSVGPELRVNPISLGNASHNGTITAKELAVQFTAPADGFYSYKEVVHSLGKNADGSGTKQVIFKVKKGTTELNTTNPVLEEDFNGTLKGIVELKEGDILYFTANMYGNTTLTSADNKHCGAGIDELVIEKLNEEDISVLPMNWYEGLEKDETTGWELTKKGQWELVSFVDPSVPTVTIRNSANDNLADFANNPASHIGPQPYIESALHRNIFYGTTDWTTWYVNYGTRWNGGPIFAHGGDQAFIRVSAFKADSGKYPTVVFNVTEDGVYTFNETIVGNYFAAATECTVRKNGKVIASFTPTEADPKRTLNGTVTLNAGDKLMFTFALASTATSDGQPGDDVNYSVGISDVYAIKTGDICAKADHDYVDGVCKTCGYDCVHDWKNETGTCTVCGVSHTHEGGEANCVSGALCETCGYAYTDKDLNNHNWTNKDGVCANCYTSCTNHDVKNEKGTCATCGMTHTHIGGEANCKNGAICMICEYEYTGKNSENHINERYVPNEDGTHNHVCDCGTIEEDMSCEYGDDNVCDDCGYDRTADVYAEIFDSVFTEGATTTHKAQGPASADALVGAVDGKHATVTYRGFSLELAGKGADYVYLRHHMLLTATQAENLKVDGEIVEPTLVSGNYYYVDVKVNVGDLGVAHVVTVDDAAVVTASVHSYMKTAFEADAKNPDALTDAQENLLKALYDWDIVVADANANANA